MKVVNKIFKKKNIKWFAIIILIIMVIIFFSLRRSADEIKIKDYDLYQYLTGIKIEYTGTIKMNKETEDITKISFKEESVELDSTPIYYKDSIKALFPKNMIVLYPHSGESYRLNYFATIYKELEDVYIKSGNLEKNMTNAIIYDGSDLYFLADDFEIKFGNETINLKAMSYIIVDTLNQTVQIYDREKDEFKIFEGITEEVIISNKRVKVNATLDLMYYNGKSRLILKQIDKLRKLK